MGRNQRDEPQQALIVDSTNTSATDQKLPVNLCIDALIKEGVVAPS